MQWLYPDAYCTSVYTLDADTAQRATKVVAWGWDAVVRHELLRRGVSPTLLPTEAEIDRWRNLQHRATILPLQSDCHAIHSIEEMEQLLQQSKHWVMKAPWSGAGRGLRWVHGTLTDIDMHWMLKHIRTQRCIIAEPRRDVLADFAWEYWVDEGVHFAGYSLFRTESGVYRQNIGWSDEEISQHIADLCPTAEELQQVVEQWMCNNIVGHYRGPLGVDMMACTDKQLHVAELNLRHTMGMVAHAKLVQSTPKNIVLLQ